ncbi:MAG TPA: glycogen synthase GlgA [Bacillota bacterium]|nr:glycogen synthase GlgA [Bacillota bacterium]
MLYVATEVAPFAKTGGLADVAGSLPTALSRLGHQVIVVMPGYSQIKQEKIRVTEFPVPVNGHREAALVSQIADGSDNGDQVPVYLMGNFQYFDREAMYGCQDDGERFAFFCRAVLEMLPRLDFQPDIIHCNDWQTGPICLLLQEEYRKQPFYRNTASIYTIHNLQYQGIFGKEALGWLGLGEEYFDPDSLEFYGRINFTKGGLVYSDKINAVSETYAREIQTPEFGEGLEGVLQQRFRDLAGIVNGIDHAEYDPEHDTTLKYNYSAAHPEPKGQNKFELQKELGLDQEDVPLLGLVSRLVEQKGLSLVEEILPDLLKRQVQLVFLGSGDPAYEKLFTSLAAKYPGRVSAVISFDSALAKRIYAGADIFLMPSRFEPCGLGQLIALRYGTIPVVRKTGGLADTIRDYDHETEGNGFVFEAYEARNFLQALERALTLYQQDRKAWDELVRLAMSEDCSWAKSALAYQQLYGEALKKVRG